MKGELFSVCLYVPNEDRARLFSVLSRDRTRDRGHKLKYKKFYLNIRRNFFYSGGDRALAEVAQRL